VILAGALCAALIAGAAWRLRALDLSGALAAFVVGTCTFAAGGIPGAAILLAFFISSVVLTRIGRQKKRGLVDVAKGGPRDAMQVLANGGVATVCILLAAVLGHVWALAFAGAYAAATADTWGTEIGTLASELPRSLIDGRPLATGLSGGITRAGTAAEVAGAFFIALVAAGTSVATDARSVAAVTAGGIAGALADSALGATVQARRWCPECERVCEADPHACGTATMHRSGVSWMTNDMVNLLATFVGSAVALAALVL
jgi:uncharacterized protein (TIGR00297 family)